MAVSFYPSGTSGSVVSVFGVRELQASLAGVDRSLKRGVNAEIRNRARDIADSVVIPALRKSAAAAPNAAFATRFADAMASKYDRAVTVQIPSVNPVLSGLRTGVGKKNVGGRKHAGGTRSATTASVRATLAWGSEFGPHPSSTVNHYGVPRSSKGYWVGPGVESVLPQVRNEWLDMVRDVLRRNNLTTRGGLI